MGEGEDDAQDVKNKVFIEFMDFLGDSLYSCVVGTIVGVFVLELFNAYDYYCHYRHELRQKYAQGAAQGAYSRADN